MSENLESLGERIAEQAAHLDAALHRLLTDLRAFDRGGGSHTQGARSCTHWLSWRVGWGLGTAREHLRVADRLADLPAPRRRPAPRRDLVLEDPRDHARRDTRERGRAARDRAALPGARARDRLPQVPVRLAA